MFVGVDGCIHGWLCVVIDRAGFVEAQLLPDFETVYTRYPDAEVFGVDMPIGLTDEAGRVADREARAFLSGQASSVFNAPPRAALAASTYDEASRLSRAQTGKGLSKQSYALFGKIRQVDAHANDPRVVEVHPEISFRTMGPKARLPSKKTWAGMHVRMARLAAVGLTLPASIGSADRGPVDDVLDAAAAAWSARRVAEGTARSFPDAPEADPQTGHAIAIWA